MKGWCTLVMPADVMQPAETVHVVPCEGEDDAPSNGHELHPLCWCGPTRITGPLEDAILSHNDPTWPGANVGESIVLQ